jgi:RsiW-degrading membrane proteinase PrsW (M82 family)
MNPFLLLAALLPAIILLVRVYRLDTIEKEPSGLLWKLILFGAISGVVAGGVEWLLLSLLGQFFAETDLAYLIIENFVIIAGTEELCKRFPVKKFAWNNPAFDYRFDAIVYCVFSAIGFAALENVLYVMQYGFSTAVTRALLSVPGHFFFAVYMGLYLGEAKEAERRGFESRRSYFMSCSLFVPMLLHGFWDFCLSFQSWIMTIIFYVFVLVFFLRANATLTRASRTDEPI